MTSDKDKAAAGQVTAGAAQIYDAFFVPALFGEWADPVCSAGRVSPGMTVVDIACGTGAVTRVARQRVGDRGRVTGVDCNKGMLEMARARLPDVAFDHGFAEDLSLAEASQDAVLCAFGLMFFEDRTAALREMRRVLAPGGTCALAVWDRVETSPGYHRMIALLEHLFGTSVADALGAPFALGPRDRLDGVLAAGGLGDARVTRRVGTAQFRSIADWVRVDVRGWTLADLIDEDQYETLLDRAKRDLADLAGPDGTVRFDAPAHIVSWHHP